ncbi:MAG: hypothetical protein KGL39_48150 [Patescibacteria group bacterium]|nr:hypothetical protein [Patescibacteria group bacterium]
MADNVETIVARAKLTTHQLNFLASVPRGGWEARGKPKYDKETADALCEINLLWRFYETNGDLPMAPIYTITDAGRAMLVEVDKHND